MKKQFLKIALCTAAVGFMTTSCDNFEEMNIDPNAAPPQLVLPEYFLNQSIVNAQMNPDTAERAFILYWKDAGRQQYGGLFSRGGYDDGWLSNYFRDLSGWLKNANLAITMAEQKEADGTALPYNNNVKQISRIWRAYLLSELTDNWGSAPIHGFQGENPEFNNQQEVYEYMLTELREAVKAIDPSQGGASDSSKDTDLVYDLDWNKWIRYGNSMRMRLAMRIADVDGGFAKGEFEDAAKGPYIEDLSQTFEVVENNGWDGLTGVMTRVWNSQMISETINNLFIGLGGVKTADQINDPEKFAPEAMAKIKPANYLGIYFKDAYPTKVNDPYTGYFRDGLPQTMDPRAYANFYMPGNMVGTVYAPGFAKPHGDDEPFVDSDWDVNMEDADGNKTTINTRYTWNSYPQGNWGNAANLNGIRNTIHTPSVGQQYRSGTNKRVFFASWESYFLIAEAAVRNWSVPMGAEAAYNKGIQESFSYNGVSQYYGDYINSTDFNNNGTSVRFSHTTEASARAMSYVEPGSTTTKTVMVNYPVNNVYKNGTVNNDQLTKIITQKFIANTPWLPLETWSDHRRLGLPFFENPAVETPIPDMPHLNSGNYMVSSMANFPQRLPYPSFLRTTDPNGYAQAVSLLGGDDIVMTPVWFAKKP